MSDKNVDARIAALEACLRQFPSMPAWEWNQLRRELLGEKSVDSKSLPEHEHTWAEDGNCLYCQFPGPTSKTKVD